jgi:hypothetical protein
VSLFIQNTPARRSRSRVRLNKPGDPSAARAHVAAADARGRRRAGQPRRHARGDALPVSASGRKETLTTTSSASVPASSRTPP